MGTKLTKRAALEMMRQTSVAGIPGEMFAELVSGGCSDYSIVFEPGRNSGLPASRESGVTLYVKKEQLEKFKDIVIDYRENLSGGGFFVEGNNIHASTCGNCFSMTKYRDS